MKTYELSVEDMNGATLYWVTFMSLNALHMYTIDEEITFYSYFERTI